MYSEAVKRKINTIYVKGCSKNWNDFFYVSFILFSLGTISAYFYPILNLWMAFYPLGVVALSFFIVFGGDKSKSNNPTN